LQLMMMMNVGGATELGSSFPENQIAALLPWP